MFIVMNVLYMQCRVNIIGDMCLTISFFRHAHLDHSLIVLYIYGILVNYRYDNSNCIGFVDNNINTSILIQLV